MRQPRKKGYGFSLLEMIAVMAITSVLAGVLMPSLIRGIQQSYSKAEAQSMLSLVQSLRQYTLSKKRIPSRAVSDWSVALADNLGQSPAQIAQNGRGYNRALFLDPRFLHSTANQFNGFSQNRGLTAAPFSPRAIFVSDLNNNVLTRQLNAAQFNALWEQSASALYKESKEIKVERINFSSLFHRVLLTNQKTSAAGFITEDGAMGTVQPHSGGIDGAEERYILGTSQLKLFDSTDSSVPFQTTVLVNGSTNFRHILTGTNWNWVNP
ncbi:MAG: prepilin-type N-terminal cleavage/methylation domain-containing protein [Granulosicoccaceae bacterium]